MNCNLKDAVNVRSGTIMGS